MEGFTIDEEMLYCPGPTFRPYSFVFFFDDNDPKGA